MVRFEKGYCNECDTQFQIEKVVKPREEYKKEYYNAFNFFVHFLFILLTYILYADINSDMKSIELLKGLLILVFFIYFLSWIVTKIAVKETKVFYWSKNNGNKRTKSKNKSN